MKIGDIILIPFPFAEITKVKLRPALVISETKDKYHDLIVCAISSVVPDEIGEFELLIKPETLNKLKTNSIIKVDRIFTLKKENKIADLGFLSNAELDLFKTKFIQLIN